MGDEVLRRLGAILARSCRREDLAARDGGEEFVLILRGLDPEAAQRACERVRAAVAATVWADLQPGLRVAVSIGLAHHDEASAEPAPQALLALAHSRLYAAKRGRRNRVVDQGPSPAAAAPHRTDAALTPDNVLPGMLKKLGGRVTGLPGLATGR